MYLDHLVDVTVAVHILEYLIVIHQTFPLICVLIAKALQQVSQPFSTSHHDTLRNLVLCLWQALEHDVAERVTADPAGRQLRVATGGEAGDAWRALGILGGLDRQLKRLSGVLMDGLVSPLLAAQGPLRVTSVRQSSCGR